MAPRLFGFKGGAVLPAEARALRLAASRLFAGDQPPEVNSWMNSQGYQTTLGNPWRVEAMVNTLSHPRLAGLDKNGEPIEGAESVFSIDEHQRLLALFAAYKKPSAEERADPYEYLLTGEAASCGDCDHSMTSFRPTAGGTPSYRCPPPKADGTSCGAISITAERLEGTVAEQVLAELLRPGAQERIVALLRDVKAELARLGKFVDDAKAEEARLRELRRDKVLSKATYDAALKALRKQLKDAQTRAKFLDQMVVSVPTGGVDDLIAWWESAPITSRRALVRLETDKILVLPGLRGGGSDPVDRVNIVWSKAKVAPGAEAESSKDSRSKAA
ncbi:recombinase zinc beta ribbon domain-containing protein [Streptomyces abikoensis]